MQKLALLAVATWASAARQHQKPTTGPLEITLDPDKLGVAAADRGPFLALVVAAAQRDSAWWATTRASALTVKEKDQIRDPINRFAGRPPTVHRGREGTAYPPAGTALPRTPRRAPGFRPNNGSHG